MDYIKNKLSGVTTSDHKPSAKKVVISEHIYRSLIENSADAIAVLSDKGKVLYTTPSLINVLGYTKEETLDADIYMLAHRDDIQYIENIMLDILKHPGIPLKINPVRMRHKDGSFRWLEVTLTNMLHDPFINGIVDNFRDITTDKLAEEKLVYENRLYGFISQINQAILHVKDENALFTEACRVAVDKGGFSFAWIGMTNNFNREIALDASWGTTETDKAFFTDYIYEPEGPIAKVIGGMEYYAIAEIHKNASQDFINYAIHRGFKSAICLALKKSGNIIGTFSMYSTEKQFFNQKEIALLQEATNDLSFALDIFEKDRLRTLTQEKLKHSELRLSQAQSIAHLGSWEINFSTGIAQWSDEMLRIYGLNPNEYIQSFKSWLSFIHPEDIIYVREVIRHAETTNKNTSFHHRIIRMDGSIRHIFSQAQFEFNSQEQVIGLNGTALDVTDTKIAEQAMVQSQKNLRLIVDSIPLSIFAKDYDGKYVFVNKSFAALHGMTTKQLINKTMAETLPDKKGLDSLAECDREVMSTGITKIIPEFPFIDRLGKEHIFHLTKMPYLTAGKNVRSVLCIALDTTEQKHLDLERSKMITEIIQRNKDLEQFSYIVSHNLRAPVANIIGLGHELNHADHNTELKKMLTEELSSAVKRIDDIIIDLNSILRVREISETNEKINLQELTNSIVYSIKHHIKHEKVKIITNFKEVEELVTIKGYLHSIFYNLIYNSIKYRRPDISPVIEIQTRRVAGKIQLIFKDNGSGIDLEKTGEQVFGLYKRFHHNIEGKGMGLFMVKTQVETLGGKITIRSKVNEGTRFCIEFEN